MVARAHHVVRQLTSAPVLADLKVRTVLSPCRIHATASHVKTTQSAPQISHEERLLAHAYPDLMAIYVRTTLMTALAIPVYITFLALI